ncbi:hypothetical protein MOVI109754_11380 [Moritella viscosa]
MFPLYFNLQLFVSAEFNHIKLNFFILYVAI